MTSDKELKKLLVVALKKSKPVDPIDFKLSTPWSKMTQEEKLELTSKIKTAMDERHDRRNAAPAVDTGVCMVCKGEVSGTYSREMTCSPSEIIYGPGGDSQSAWVFSGYSCQSCGIKYQKLPPKKAERRGKKR